MGSNKNSSNDLTHKKHRPTTSETLELHLRQNPCTHPLGTRITKATMKLKGLETPERLVQEHIYRTST